MRNTRGLATVTAAALIAIGLGLLARPARAFPGLCVGRDDARRTIHTAQVVLLLHPELSVVTVMADHQGPVTPFALVLPVPPDVVRSRVQIVKREFVDRVAEVSAPRFHAFYEMDPCRPGTAEQQWDSHIEARGTGFLGRHVPPADRKWKVPKEIAIPTEPLFKQSESEFAIHVRSARDTTAFAQWMKKRGYRLDEAAHAALLPYLDRGMKLLVAEVHTDHVELVASDWIQLGAIRYWSREPATRIAATLGTLSSPGVQDLFVYVLHPDRRYHASNYANVLPPTNLRVDRSAAEQVGPLYNALFDLLLDEQPRSVVGEYAWSTAGCGEPCPDAPLQLRELMTLGGDVVEEQTVPQAARHPEPPPEPEADQDRREQRLEALPARQRARARREHRELRRELARRRALVERQRYVLSRLHYRYAPDALPDDLDLAPAPDHARGGVGIPRGALGELPTGTARADRSRFQVRFVDLRPWTRDIRCPEPRRWRWGKRWKHLGHVVRKVWIGRDLPRAGRDRALAHRTLRTALPELGLGLPPPLREPPPVPADESPASGNCDCRTSGTRAPPLPGALGLAAALALGRRRRRSR